MSFEESVEIVGKAIDGIGVVIIAAGIAYTTIVFLQGRRLDRPDPYRSYRRGIGRAILLGLEFLVAGDIIRTVAVDLTLQAVGTLGLLVLVRTFLSFALEVELEGRWPWEKRRARGEAEEE